jgi:hypothetical protein
MIGCGDVTERKSGPGFRKAAHSELVAVMRRNGALAADYARRHGVARWHDDAEAILRADAAPDPDHVHQPLIQTIVDELNGSGKCPSTGESAARTAHVMEAILAEFRERSSELR